MRPSLRAAMMDRWTGPGEKIAIRMIDKTCQKTPEVIVKIYNMARSEPELRYGTPLFAKLRWCKMIGGGIERQGYGWTLHPLENAGTRREQLRSTAEWPARNPYPNSRRRESVEPHLGIDSPSSLFMPSPWVRLLSDAKMWMHDAVLWVILGHAVVVLTWRGRRDKIDQVDKPTRLDKTLNWRICSRAQRTHDALLGVYERKQARTPRV